MDNVYERLLESYGRRMGYKRVITQEEFRRLQLDGSIARFMRRLGRYDHI